MNQAKASNWKPEVEAPYAWWTPQVRSCLVCIALLLPGSFLVLPLIWLCRRRLTALAALAAPRSPRSRP